MDDSEMKKDLKRIIKAYNYLKTEHDKHPLDKIDMRLAAISDIGQSVKEIVLLFAPELVVDIRL